MAKYAFSNTAFSISFSWRERLALGRPQLDLERARIISAEMANFPGKSTLGRQISRKYLFLGPLGEYLAGFNRMIVLGNLQGSGLSLKIKVSHPNIDVIWVLGSQVKDLESRLLDFIQKN